MFDFLKLDLVQLIDTLRPVVVPYMWFIVPVVSFLRTIPVLGLILIRFPIFVIACLFVANLPGLILLMILNVLFALLGDLVIYHKTYKFWYWFINKIPEDSRTERILSYYKRYPFLVTLLGTYSAYTQSLLAPLAHKYKLNILQFWIPRILMFSFLTIFYGLIYFYLGVNNFLLSLASNVGWLVIASLIVGVIISFVHLFKYLKQIKLKEVLLKLRKN